VNSIEALEAFARDHSPGCFDVDEQSLEAFDGSNAKARAWGTVIL
jgi:hypothetical protein